MEEKIYLFISHSHKDLEQVRILRNYVESLGAEPILFFLKSLTDKDKITKLIEDEIDARIWFFYCKSTNAEQSRWVQSEIDYAKASGKQNLLEIDLESDFCDGDLTEKVKNLIRSKFHSIRRNREFYMSYSHEDRVIVQKITKHLQQYGITLWVDEHLLPGESFLNQLSNVIEETSPFFLLCISKISLSSVYVIRELDFAMSLKKTIVPIIFQSQNEDDDYYQPFMQKMGLMQFPYFFFDTDHWEYSANQLVNYILDLYEK